MCNPFGGGGNSNSTSSGKSTATVEFNPTITIGGNSIEPAQDTSSTFVARLLSAPPNRIALPDPPADEPKDQNTTKLLLYVAVALAARKVLRG